MKMATETPAQMAARFRKIAEDKSLPQSVRNTYLDKANAAEKATAKPTMNKGGAMLPVRGSRTAKHKEMKMMYGGAVKPMAEKKPAMMNKGGMPMVEKDGMKVPAFAADGKGKMAKGGMVKKDFKPCEGCPTPAKCKAAGKCMAKEGKGGKPAFAVMIAVGKPAAKKGK